MWPAVDHIHILSDPSLPGVNGGRAIQTRGPCYLPNNRDTESSRGRVAKQHVVLGPLGERGQPRRTGVSPSKARVLRAVYSAIFLRGYKPPWASASSVWFALSLSSLPGNTHNTDQDPLGVVAARSCREALNTDSSVQPVACSSRGQPHSLAKCSSGWAGLTAHGCWMQAENSVLLSLT